MAVTITIQPDFSDKLFDGVFNLSTDALRVALSNAAPASEAANPMTTGNGVLANVTQIAYTNYADTLAVDRVLEGITTLASGGKVTLDAADFSISAAGGALAAWQYIYVHDSTVAGSPIIAMIDVGAAVSLASGDSRNITFDALGIVSVG